ncbi:MAG: 50S ribosomal protein L27 [Candidatus Lloydbacteria bacterium RIFCSPHIGHO2_01_FULL_49_22]|uniref:Large ribosomal subunit protein bL27 n=1 Tax=Candidatus Lloydbacteria bacterium RIFCSPHIGHO2_01_FULL_49_22 TaxID=1798658 RepID=A0A1G2CUU7_9BACT|nr:MAG: 50S ribosomal protein L27 [Candidatus Lloydbacteria bacterium RIFCSPHIGHO2_01_FULL_49_22]OGZ10311.1 MAG: 50S ribosomal protein L27 [Candidatus Lloydbacteria bacterium RIFCSPHIGHO2_02_FULL_50_18]
MSTKKSGGSSKNLRDSNPKYLGMKLHDGQVAAVGNILVRQRGTRVVPGKNVKVGKDHTLYSMVGGKVTYKTVRKTRFDGKILSKKMVSVN